MFSRNVPINSFPIEVTRALRPMRNFKSGENGCIVDIAKCFVLLPVHSSPSLEPWSMQSLLRISCVNLDRNYGIGGSKHGPLRLL